MCTSLITWRATRNAQGSVVSHPHLLHVHISNASGGSTATGDNDAGFFLARILSRGDKRHDAGGLGERMSPDLSRWTGIIVSATYQLGALDQVGGPSAAAVRGSYVGDSS